MPFYNFMKPEEPKGYALMDRFQGFEEKLDMRDLRSLLDQMLALDPERRCTAKAAADADFLWRNPAQAARSALPRVEVN